MSLTKIRQSQVTDLEKKLREITDQIKTFRQPIDLYKNMPIENNNEGDIRVCLEDNNVYVWGNGKWNINEVKGSFSRVKFIIIDDNNKTAINTGIRFDATGEDRTNNTTINLYLNGVLVESGCYNVQNINDEMVIEWIEQTFPLQSGDLIGVEFYDITGGLKIDLPSNVPSTNDSEVMVVGKSILPKKTKTVDIGSEELRFRSIYVDEAYLSTNTLYIGDTPILGTEQDNIMIKGDPDQSIMLRTHGIGDSKICSDNNVEIISKGIGGNINIKSEGTLSKINLASSSQVAIDSPLINLNGKVNFISAAIEDLVVRGNLTVDGTTTTINSTNMAISDNIIEVNKNEAGTGVSLKEAGLKINRGDLDSYFVIFDEDTDNLKIGTKSDLQDVATKYWVSTELNKYTGDMKKEIYDADNDGIVDKALTLKGLTVTSNDLNKVTEIDALNTKSHIHTNDTILNKLSESNGNLQYDGKDIISSGNSSAEVFQTNVLFPPVSQENTFYVALDNNSTGLACIYLGKNGGYINLYDGIEGPGAGSSNGTLNQVTKLNVVAPKDVRIQIKETTDFNLPDINVLKFVPGEENVVNNICDFDNADSTDFEENANVIFDGTMKLKTNYELDLTQEGELATVTFNKANLNVTKIEII